MTRPSPLVAVTLGVLLSVPAARAADLDAEPIRYSSAPDHNAAARLRQRLAAGQTALTFEEHFGYLRSLLREFGVPESSQVLVFSKTSLQRHRIGPRRPRALYFNDDNYVGFCQNGEVLEVTVTDPRLGAVFYTLDQKPGTPRLARHGDNCLICHGSSANQGFPGHLVRSVYPDDGGQPILSLGSFRTDQTSPLRERWGGWYVSGTSGRQAHLGNLITQERQLPDEIDNKDGVNVTDLSDRFKVKSYLTPHSDLVALMVLEHQAELHNRLTRANFLTRQALYEEADLNKMLGRPASHRSESTVARIRSAGEPLVKYLLFSGEAKLTERVAGTSPFAEEFVCRGPRDARGRSLRDFDLERRLFKYPCSYLIYSEAFDALPEPVKGYVARRLGEVLTGKDSGADFAHLSAADRQAIREILAATKPDLTRGWK